MTCFLGDCVLVGMSVVTTMYALSFFVMFFRVIFHVLIAAHHNELAEANLIAEIKFAGLHIRHWCSNSLRTGTYVPI